MIAAALPLRSPPPFRALLAGLALLGCVTAGANLRTAIEDASVGVPLLDVANIASYVSATSALFDRVKKAGGNQATYFAAERPLYQDMISRAAAIAGLRDALKGAASVLAAAEQVATPEARASAQKAAAKRVGAAAAILVRALSSGPLPKIPLPGPVLRALDVIAVLAGVGLDPSDGAAGDASPESSADGSPPADATRRAAPAQPDASRAAAPDASPAARAVRG